MIAGPVIGEKAKDSYRNLMVIGVAVGCTISVIFYILVKDSEGDKREVQTAMTLYELNRAYIKYN